MKPTLFILLVTLFANTAIAQQGGMKGMAQATGRVYGKLVDADTRKPVEFAAVAVLWFNKDSVIGGALAEAPGRIAPACSSP